MSASSVPLNWKPSDFDLPNATPIGAGALSYVLRATHTATKATVAVKILSKIQLLQQGKVQAVMTEKECLYTLGPHPFIARLLGTAQSEDELYFVMEHLPHGDLLQHIRTVHADRVAKSVPPPQQQVVEGEEVSAAAAPAATTATSSTSSGPVCLDFNDIQLILAQLVVSLSHAIRKGFVLRDLKPENICFDSEYRCCLIDFDTAAKDAPPPHTNYGKPIRGGGGNAAAATSSSPPVGQDKKRRKTVSEIQGMRSIASQFCGTAQYVSPEMVGECAWSFSSDLWALGIIAYQCLYGVYPFKGSNSFSVMKRLVHGIRPEKHFAVEVNLEEADNGPRNNSSEDVTPPEVVANNGLPKFRRVTSFISSLLRVDPTLRLGVNPLTLAFDESQLRNHALFDGFNWALIDDEVAQYKFPGAEALLKESVAVSASSASGTASDEIANKKGRIAAALHRLPSHSEAYASYVCTASNNDSNPFDAWAHRYDDNHQEDDHKEANASANVGDTPTTKPVVDPTSSDDEYYSTNRARAAKTTGGEEPSSSSSGEDDDVEDDVGVQQIGHADTDFQEEEEQ
ncbi:protein kinase, putative [Bodo saltans]|uniref:non-specific serine/threonine protein kinase n=1 Tax=Bodo saltans TaxID=75058 RepID=A0A0S4IZ51_BODSA|nr:protein kinase, putative [Bodo saltans]|eukprot:CUG06675.1 protein kinase, putative [Bodo saltans]